MQEPIKKEPRLTISEQWEILKKIFEDENAMEILMG